jgi:hypothetical protein
MEIGVKDIPWAVKLWLAGVVALLLAGLLRPEVKSDPDCMTIGSLGEPACLSKPQN